MTKQERQQTMMNQLKTLKGAPTHRLEDGFYEIIGCMEGIKYAQEELDADPKLAYLVDKYGL